MGLSLKRVADPAYADLDWRAELAEAEISFEHVEADEPAEELFEEIDFASDDSEME